MKITLLNHASLFIESGSVKLLTDPWYWGTCFEDGWGLRYDNPEALELTKTCTHLWISHPHSDHLHGPTLAALAKHNPNIVVLGNRSYNFNLDDILRKFGFTQVLPFLERTPMTLGDGIEVTRFPTTGIDNMLLIKTTDGVLLNYNDCVIPPYSRKALKKKFGPIDVLFCNFNHAGKLLRYPKREDTGIKNDLKNSLKSTIDSFDAKYVIPFASYHYYRAAENLVQNPSLLEIEDVAGVSEKILPVHVGQSATLTLQEGAKLLAENPAVTRNAFSVKERLQSIPFPEIASAAEGYCKKLRKGFPLLHKLLPPLRIRVTDLAITVSLSPGTGLKLEESPTEACDIEAHSEALQRWLSKPYGTDSFVVGAHFGLIGPRVKRVKWHFIYGLLVDNRIDALSLIKMTLSPRGWRFLLNRREEITGILLSRTLAAEYQQ